MTRKKKILVGLIAALGALFAVMVLVLLFWLGPTLKAVVRFVIPKALGTPVAIERLYISPRHGTVELSGFVLSNQDGFGRTNAVSLGRLEICLDLSSVFTSTVVVHNVEIDSPALTYEQSDATDNILAFIQDFEEFANMDLKARLEERRSQDRDETEPSTLKVVIVESMSISNVLFNLANSVDPKLDMEVRVAELRASMTNGVASISAFTVSNPSRLRAPHLFSLDRLDVSLEPDSIYSDLVLVKDVEVNRPWFFLEKNPETDTGAELMKIVDSFSKRLAAAPPPEVLEEMVRDAMVVPVEGLPARLDRLAINEIGIHLVDFAADGAEARLNRLFGIDEVVVDPLDGEIIIQKIAARNPGGFSSENLFELQALEISFDPASVLSDQVVVRKVEARSPLVSLEQTERGGNVAELRAMILDLTPPELMELAAPPATTNQLEKPAFDLANQPAVVNSLVVTNLVVDLVVPEEERDDERIDEDGRLAIVAFDRLVAEPMEGRVDIERLRVANPLGFANPHLVTMDHFVVDVDLETIDADTLYVEEIAIQRPRVAYERKIKTDNIKALQKEVESKMEDRERNQREAAEKRDVQPADPVEEQKVAIGRFVMRKGLVKLKLSILPSAPIPLPTIELKNIGRRDEGADVQDAFAEIGTTVYAAILDSVSSSTGYASHTVKNATLASIAMNVAVPPMILVDGEWVPREGDPSGGTDASEPKRKSRRRAGGRTRIL